MFFFAAFTAILCNAAPASAAQCTRQSLGGPKNWSFVDHAFTAWMRSKDRTSDWSRQKSVDLGDGERAVATYTATHFGNGTIRIKNLELRTWRAHTGEGYTYNPPALTVEISAKPKTHICVMTVSGKIEKLSEDEDKPIGLHPVKLVYEYDRRNHAFVRVKSLSPILIEEIDFSSRKDRN